MKTAAALLAGIVIGALGCYYGARLYERRGMDTVPVCEARVHIARAGDTFEVKPKNVCLYVGHHLKWEIDTPAGDQVDIVFDAPDKPFKHPQATSDNPHPGVYTTRQPKDLDSNEALTIGRWDYKVKWTPQGGTEKVLDPAVCIRGG
jgi:hypothetical protein